MAKPARLYFVKGSYRKVAWAAEHLAFFIIVLSASPRTSTLYDHLSISSGLGAVPRLLLSPWSNLLLDLGKPLLQGFLVYFVEFFGGKKIYKIEMTILTILSVQFSSNKYI